MGRLPDLDLVNRLLSAHLGLNVLKDETSYVQDLELSSLDLLKMTNDLSNRLSISLSVVDVFAHPKVADFRDFVIGKCKQSLKVLAL